MKFRDLQIGATFDFIGPRVGYNSFFRRCVKLSARTYTTVEGEDAPTPMRVGSINCEVFHVGEDVTEYVEMGRANAAEAIDQAEVYGGLEPAIAAYRVNVTDTLREMGCKSPLLERAARDSFEAAILAHLVQTIGR